MKNQYFADTRDLFKYDLILDLLKKSRLTHFSFIPMLTPDEPEYGRGRTNYATAKIPNKQIELRSFLGYCLRTNKRRIGMLEQFFARSASTEGLRISIYEKENYLSNSAREDYFRRIPSAFLTKSVILIDPDIGLEVPSMKGKEENYLTYDEARTLQERMDEKSTMLIFRFIPRVSRIPYLRKIANQLCNRVTGGVPVHYVSDNSIAFFASAKTSKSMATLSDHLASYVEKTGLLFGRN